MCARYAEFLEQQMAGGPVQVASRYAQDMRDLNARIRQCIQICPGAEAGDPLSSLHGLVLSDDHAKSLLDDLDAVVGLEGEPDLFARPDRDVVGNLHGSFEPEVEDREHFSERCESALSHLCRTFELSADERRCIVAALAPELDWRYERLYGYLLDDMTRRGASVGLTLRLLSPQTPLAKRCLLAENSRLVRWRIVRVFDRVGFDPGSFLSQGINVDSRVVEYLLDGRYEQSLASLDRSGEFACVVDRAAWKDGLPAPQQWQHAEEFVASQRASGATLRFVLAGPVGCGQRELSEALAQATGQRLHWVSAKTQLSGYEAGIVAAREAVLNDAALGVEHLELAQADPATVTGLAELLHLTKQHVRLTILTCNSNESVPQIAGLDDAFVIQFRHPTLEERVKLWRTALAETLETYNDSLAMSAARAQASPEQIRVIASRFSRIHRLDPAAANAALLHRMCRSQHVERVPGVIELEPMRVWSDLVLPHDVKSQLEELCAQARNRSTVMSDWGFAARFSGGKGLHALFSGPSGTGKTLAAEVIARTLSRRWWRIDLAQLVSKYIGETEKNIDRIFAAADSDEILLFFDEADALFGRRSEVKDAHDRYANQEVSYLLQQMEEYEGVAILATNLARNVDEAFLRRLQFLVDFPIPDEEHRQRIWEVILPESVPVGADVDFGSLAKHVRLSGGHLRNVALAAAYLAAEQGSDIRMHHFWHAARREFQKIGQSWSPP